MVVVENEPVADQAGYMPDDLWMKHERFDQITVRNEGHDLWVFLVTRFGRAISSGRHVAKETGGWEASNVGLQCPCFRFGEEIRHGRVTKLRELSNSF